MPPTGSGLITTSGDFLTVYVAGHQKKLYISPVFQSISQCVWQVTKQKYEVSITQHESVCPVTTAGEGDLLKARRGGDPDGILFVCGSNTSPKEFSVRPSVRHAVSRKLIIMAENITHGACWCRKDNTRI
jgi:hypothetical protein